MLSTPGAEVFVGPDCRLRLVKVNPHARIEGLEAHYIITPNAMQPNLPHRRLALHGVRRRFAVPHHVSFGRLPAEFCSRLRWLAMPRIFARIWQQWDYQNLASRLWANCTILCSVCVARMPWSLAKAFLDQNLRQKSRKDISAQNRLQWRQGPGAMGPANWSDAGCTMLHVSGGDDQISPITWIRLLTHTTAQTKIAIVWESACQKQLQRTKSFVENRKPSESAMYERVNPHDGHRGAVAFRPRNDRSLPRTDTYYVNIMLNTFPQK